MRIKKLKCSPRRSGVCELGGWRSGCLAFLLCAATAVASHAQTFTSLVSFDGSDGNFPESIVQGTNGELWGTTANGGTSNCGTVFKMTTAGVLTRVVSFSCSEANDIQGIILGTDGNFYGLSFWGAGNEGTVFKLKPGGALAVLANFDGSDGSEPVGSLTESTDGNFYGATYAGGSSDWGAVFKVTPTGTLTALYNFDFTHGSQPYAGPVAGTDGNLYGTTYSGNFAGCGGIYKITLNGAITVLHSFNCTSDGAASVSSLVQGRDGNFYGTASSGGTDNYGTVFKITPSGTFTVLHKFSGTDGQDPVGALLQASDGNFYGTTANGGPNGYGTVFKMSAAGVVTTLHGFDGTDGGGAYALVQHTGGTLYGLTGNGGTSGYGTLFSLNISLKPFCLPLATSGEVGSKIGILGQEFSSSSVLSFGGTKATTIVRSGTTYITATVPAGALTGSVTVTTGTTTLTSPKIFKVLPTLTSFSPTSGPVGTSVTITGTGLTQTTKVTFAGKSATFTVISDTEVTADVPATAVTGKVTITTKGGSAIGTTSFTVD